MLHGLARELLLLVVLLNLTHTQNGESRRQRPAVHGPEKNNISAAAANCYY